MTILFGRVWAKSARRRQVPWRKSGATSSLGCVVALVLLGPSGGALLPLFHNAFRHGQIVARHAAASQARPVTSKPEAASEEDLIALQETYEVWVDQFPIAAARRDFYELPCDPESVKARFVFIADRLNISISEALGIFRKDLWVLCEPSEKLPAKLEALRGHCTSEEEVLDFLRAAPRVIGTTTAQEIQERGVANMRLRASLGEAYESLIFPLRFMFQQMAKSTASRIECEMDSEDGACSEEALQRFEDQEKASRQVQGAVFFGGLLSILLWLGYMDSTYGGPIHGKGLCPASPIPTFNLPDAEGNTRLPCTCAPIFKWYIEPNLPAGQFAGMAPKVESKNCGRTLGGTKIRCDPTTTGACVWTAEDLAKDPSVWDSRELTYWEKQRKNLRS